MNTFLGDETDSPAGVKKWYRYIACLQTRHTSHQYTIYHAAGRINHACSRLLPPPVIGSRLGCTLVSGLAALAALLPQQGSGFAPHALSPTAVATRSSQRHLPSPSPGRLGLVSGGDVSRVFRGAAGPGRRHPRKSSTSKLHMFDPGAVAATTLTAAAAAGGGDVSAWSVSSITSDLAADLFQASLLPYLAFLWLLSRKETRTPEGGTFGFAFLLVFVVATIPAGIYGESGGVFCICLLCACSSRVLVNTHTLRRRLGGELRGHERQALPDRERGSRL